MALTLIQWVRLMTSSCPGRSRNPHFIDLTKLRSRMAIIPQDPVLFNGTIRRNLDFFERHTDTDIWDTLEKVYLRLTACVL